MSTNSGRPAQSYGHFDRPDRKVALHSVVDDPTNDASRMKIEDDSQIELAFTDRHTSDVTYPFPIGRICMNVLARQVWRDVEAMIAVRRRLELLVPLHRDTALTHPPTDTAMPNLQVQLFQFFGHAWPTIAAKRSGEFFSDVRQDNQILLSALSQGTAVKCSIPSGTDIHDLTQRFRRQHVRVLYDESNLTGAL